MTLLQLFLSKLCQRQNDTSSVEDQEQANIDAAHPADHFIAVTAFTASTFYDEIVPRELIVYNDAWKADESYQVRQKYDS